MLFDALPKDYIDQMKKANQLPLEMPLEELRSYSLNIEGLNLDNRNFESVTDFHSVCYVYGRLGGRNRLFLAQVR
jgi:hypothetical protein